MDDGELITRLAAGDDGALRELFSRHAPILAARLRAVLPSSDIEDVLQETFYPAFTTVEFIEYFALLKEVPARRVHMAVAEAVERVDLGAKAKAKLRTLSGGMLRRVGIAQAIVNDPDLLLLDEPTSGLDPEQRVRFRALLRDLGKTATVVVSTHLVEDVGAACSQVALMDAGHIVFRGTPAELVARGEGHDVGDAPLERGYSAVLQAARQGKVAA